MNRKSLIYVFTGEGKGKTSAAIGVVLRSLLIGKKVTWISWYKSESWEISEKKMIEIWGKQLKMYWAGKGFYLKGDKSKNTKVAVVFDYDSEEAHKKAAKMAKELAIRELMNKKDRPELLVLDEINQTVEDGLLEVEDIKEIIESVEDTDVVMTGRKFPKELEKMVDLVTEMKKIKHPYDSGVMAKRGLDF